MPADIHLGEAAGVATNSAGHLFVYTRTGNPTAGLGNSRLFVHGGSRLFEFDRTGALPPRDRHRDLRIPGGARRPRRRAGQHLGGGRGLEPGDQVRARRPGADGDGTEGGSDHHPGAAGHATGAAAAPGSGRGGAGDQFNRPSDVAWDAAGNIFVADGHAANARVAKFDKNGRFLASWGSRGSEPGQFDTPHSIAIDAAGNVYVADQGNKRIQVFDNAGTFKAQIANVGVPTALCISRGAHQYLFSAHTGDAYGMDDAAIYKLELDGRIVGRFGKAGKLPGELGLVNALDCRSENEVFVGELANWRVQKLVLGAKSTPR